MKKIIVIHVEKIGFKDAQCLVDSQIYVQVLNEQGVELLQLPLATHKSNKKSASYIMFNTDILLALDERNFESNFTY